MTDRESPEPVQISLGEKRFVPTPPAPPEPPAPPKSIPWKKIGKGLATVLKSIPLKKIGEGLADVVKATVNLVMLGSFIAITYFAVAELRREVVVIDPIRLPEALREMGYSEDVAADRLWDEVVRINDSTPTEKESVALQPASQKFDFEPPGSGIALQEVVQILRRFARRKETRIVGEITCAKRDCKPEGLALTLRVFHGDGTKSDPIKVPPVSPNGDQTIEDEIDRCEPTKTAPASPSVDQTNEAEIDRHFRAAALELLRELDPYVVAFYLYQTDKRAAECEALLIAQTQTHPDRKWALNLLGFIAADRGKYDAAIGWYDKAVKADEKDEFAIAYYNWGNALSAKGALAKANKEPDEAKDEWAKAFEKFTRATELDPENAFAYDSWGNALGDSGDLGGAIEKYTVATTLNPKYAVAYYDWGRAHRAKGELAEAIEKFTLATELDPEYAIEILSIAFYLTQRSRDDDPADAFQRYAGDAVDAFQRILDFVPVSRHADGARRMIEEIRADPRYADVARGMIEEPRADPTNN